MKAQSSVVTPRLFFIGDSISVHYGPYLEKRVEGVYRYDRKRDSANAPKATNNLDVPTGANGGDSDRVLLYLRHRRAKHPIEADVLVVNCGLHDIKVDPSSGAIQVPLERYEANLRAIVAEGRAMAPRFIWINTTPVIDEVHNRDGLGFRRFARDVAAVNAVAEKVMGEEGVPIIDLHGFSSRHVPEGFVDHVHYTEDVREKQAEFLFGELRRLLA
jgi:GDSL-like Lipase/Acylhydrolase.